jgi:hypothetical protein
MYYTTYLHTLFREIIHYYVLPHAEKMKKIMPQNLDLYRYLKFIDWSHIILKVLMASTFLRRKWVISILKVPIRRM